MADGMDTEAMSARGVIAVVLKGYPRLSETFIAQELRGLEMSGFKLVFYSMRRPTDRTVHQIHREMQAPVTYLPEYLHEEPVRVLASLFKVSMRRGFWTALKSVFADLRRDVSRNRIRRFGQACVLAAELPADVARLYAHFIHTPSAVTRYAAMITGLPWSASAHAKDIWTSPAWELSNHLNAADWVATCTSFGHSHLQSLATRADTVHLIYHGLDLTRFPKRPEGDHGDERDGRSGDQPIRLLCVGRAVEKKGIDTLLRALAALPSQLHWQFKHIGGGSELAKLKTLAADLGLSDRISWRGAEDQSTVLAAYRESDLFVLPCRITDNGDRDGLPNVLVEAQSQRLTCISTPISGIPELIVDGETGLLVQPNDPAALAQAIGALAADPGRRQALAAAGEARVRSAFNYQEGLASLVGLFPAELKGDNSGVASDTASSGGTALGCDCRLDQSKPTKAVATEAAA